MEDVNKRINNYENQERDIRHIIPLPISVLRTFGMWRLSHWSLILKLLYCIVTVSAFTFMILDIITLFCVIYFSENPTQTFFESCFFIFSVLCTLCKASGVVIKHDKIVFLFKMLLEDQCKPRDAEEVAIQNKTDSDSRYAQSKLNE